MKRYVIFLLSAMVCLLWLAAVQQEKVAAAVSGDNPWSLADTAWPTHQQNSQRTGLSPHQGVTSGPLMRWAVTGYSNLTAAGITVGISDTLIVRTWDNTLLVDFDGNVLSDERPGGLCGSMPTQLQNGHLIYYTAFTLIHLDAAGETVWEIPFAVGCYYPTAAISEEGVLYIPLGVDRVIAVDLASNELLWEYVVDYEAYMSTNTVALGPDGTIYFTVDYGLSPDLLIALNPDGSLKWERNVLTGTIPAVAPDGTIYLADSTLKAYSPEGDLLWQLELFAPICRYTIAPAIGPDGTIYVGMRQVGDVPEARFYAVNPNGTVKWEYTIPAVGGEASICSSPVVDRDGNVYFCADNGRCYGLAPDGRKLWEVTTAGEGHWLRTSPVIARDGFMILPAGDTATAIAIEQATEGIYLPLVVR
jgi:outer membrane protein assembly factor BamB